MAAPSPIALFYFTYLGALGLYWPYFSLYLASVGLAPSEVTAILALAPVAGLLAPPITGLLADARRARVWVLRGASLAATVAFAGFLRPSLARPALYATFCAFAVCRAPLTSLVDAAALDSARRTGSSYGRLRLWGSLGFLVAAVGGGAWFQVAGMRTMLAATVAALGIAAACAWLIAAPPIAARPRVLRAWGAMLRTAELWLFLGAVVVAQIANAIYDAGFSLHLSRLGFGSRFVGAAWGLGVAAEVVLIGISGRVMARFGAERLFATSITVAAVRWLVTARVTSQAAILAVAPLHGITFGCFYVAAVSLMRDRATHETPTAAQGLLASALGCGSVIGMVAAGQVLGRFGGRALFSVAAAASACGAAAAWIFARRAHARAALALEAAAG